MLVKAAARVRGLFAGNYAENDEDQQVLINNRGDHLVAQALPELTELVRLGDTWQVKLATGLAALTALPTTVAGISIYNGEPATGKCYIIEAFGSHEAVVDAVSHDVHKGALNFRLNGFVDQKVGAENFHCKSPVWFCTVA